VPIIRKSNASNIREILVEVAYGSPLNQMIIEVGLAEPCSAEDAIKASGILLKFTEIDLRVNTIGIFGKRCKLDRTVRHRDRVEIYRTLTADPKQLRRESAEKNRQNWKKL
jgi:putative ubiquitin-RnfH superfamily antitoxin RatB of RatAB toxin-antitoxin module